MTLSLQTCCLLRAIVATSLLAVAAGPGFAQELKYKALAVTTPDGQTISAQDWGNPTGPEILFIHGFSRPLDATAMMSELSLPVLVTHGAEDRNAKLGAGQYTAATIPGAKLSVYEGTGHSPFYEDAPRFNGELAAFVRAANKTN